MKKKYIIILSIFIIVCLTAGGFTVFWFQYYVPTRTEKYIDSVNEELADLESQTSKFKKNSADFFTSEKIDASEVSSNIRRAETLLKDFDKDVENTASTCSKRDVTNKSTRNISSDCKKYTEAIKETKEFYSRLVQIYKDAEPIMKKVEATVDEWYAEDAKDKIVIEDKLVNWEKIKNQFKEQKKEFEKLQPQTDEAKDIHKIWLDSMNIRITHAESTLEYYQILAKSTPSTQKTVFEEAEKQRTEHGVKCRASSEKYDLELKDFKESIQDDMKEGFRSIEEIGKELEETIEKAQEKYRIS